MNPVLRVSMAFPLLTLAVACSPGARDGGPSSSGTDAGATDTPAAVVDGATITVAELDDWIKDQLWAQQTEGGDPMKTYELRSRALDNMINERLVAREAEKRGTTPDALVEAEAEKRLEVSDDEVRAFYDEHKERLGKADFESLAPQIRNMLRSQRAQSAAREYVQSLRQDVDVEVELDAPRVEVAAVGPSQGPADAPVTIVEFSDYQCPFCRRAEPTIERVLEAYPDKVRFVYRHYPLDRIHPLARGAAEAAACAAAQDRFWPFHEQVFAGDASQLEPADLEGFAEKAGLDMERYRKCVADRETRDEVAADLAAGSAAGVSGTPAFFVNGILLSGARPYEDFVKLIESELARTGGAAEPTDAAEPGAGSAS